MHVPPPAPTQFTIWSSPPPGRVDPLFRPPLPRATSGGGEGRTTATTCVWWIGGVFVCACVLQEWGDRFGGDVRNSECNDSLAFPPAHFPVYGYVVLMFPVNICLGPSNTQVSISG